jgi:hypothetical protein
VDAGRKRTPPRLKISVLTGEWNVYYEYAYSVVCRRFAHLPDEAGAHYHA